MIIEHKGNILVEMFVNEKLAYSFGSNHAGKINTKEFETGKKGTITYNIKENGTYK